MSVIIASHNAAELRLVKEMIDVGQYVLRQDEKRREELRRLQIPMDVNIIFKKIKEDELKKEP